jgi:hypothetical protein
VIGDIGPTQSPLRREAVHSRSRDNTCLKHRTCPLSPPTPLQAIAAALHMMIVRRSVLGPRALAFIFAAVTLLPIIPASVPLGWGLYTDIGLVCYLNLTPGEA